MYDYPESNSVHLTKRQLKKFLATFEVTRPWPLELRTNLVDNFAKYSIENGLGAVMTNFGSMDPDMEFRPTDLRYPLAEFPRFLRSLPPEEEVENMRDGKIKYALLARNSSGLSIIGLIHLTAKLPGEIWEQAYQTFGYAKSVSQLRKHFPPPRSPRFQRRKGSS